VLLLLVEIAGSLFSSSFKLSRMNVMNSADLRSIFKSPPRIIGIVFELKFVQEFKDAFEFMAVRHQIEYKELLHFTYWSTVRNVHTLTALVDRL
jgi:hypothetical protein